MQGGHYQPRHPQPNTTKMRILSFISEFCKTNGYSPTIREIRDGVGLKSTGNVQQHLDQLLDDGLICHHPNRIRSITPATYFAS